MPSNSIARFTAGNGESLPNVYMAMGETAEWVADQEGITRAEMDAFAARSQDRAVRAQSDGVFTTEIVPVTREDGTVVEGETYISAS